VELWIDERRSRRFPEGLLDQPFYGWVLSAPGRGATNEFSPAF